MNTAQNIFGLFVVAPSLAYLAYQNYNAQLVSKTMAMVFLVLAALVLLYYGYNLFTAQATNTTSSNVLPVGVSDFTKGTKVNAITSSGATFSVAQPEQPSPMMGSGGGY